MNRIILRKVLLSCALALFAGGHTLAAVGTPQKVLNVDLTPKIEASAARRERFAVNVPHAANLANAGSWERAAGVSTWRYSLRIPTAVSLSFHAAEFQLPPGATLKVTNAAGAQAVYLPTDGGRLGLWSRISRGDSLWFELSVPTVNESGLRFSIASLQAGYRGLGGGVVDHPHYSKLRSAALAAALAPCDENFACHLTDENGHNADATAAIVIGGVALCTATLVNNLRNDGTPYLLSARHCQDSPDSGVVAYWDAMTPCGETLGSIYDTNSPAYLSSTHTVFEQQDVWLLQLESPLTAERIYFSGWDATGGTFVGGYSPHHALGFSRQYTEWFGQPAMVDLPGSVLGVGYDSNYWGVVNSIGRVGSGASGGGLFSPEHRLVGVASMASIDVDGFGQCPAASPPAPSASTASALYSALSAVWESNSDTTSFTNPVTLKSLLDPDGTGQRVSDGIEMLPGVTLGVDSRYGSTGRMQQLTWTAPGSATCTASGGAAGDGWAGARPANGSVDITRYESGLTTYTLRCTDAGRFAVRSVSITWVEIAPSLYVNPTATGGTLGGTIEIFWNSNLQPCVATGGVSGDGWAGSKASRGPQTIPLTQVGAATYTITCGSGSRQLSQTVTSTVYLPFATLESNTNNMRVGSEVIITAMHGGLDCVRSGGVPGSGWTTSPEGIPFRVTSANAGTFRFTLTCQGGPTPAVANLDLTFTNAAPAATLVANKATAEIYDGGPIQDNPDGTWPIFIEFEWQSNVTPCQLSFDGPGSEDGNVHLAMEWPGAGTALSGQALAGTYVYTITCVNGADTATASTTVDFVAPGPRVDLDHSEHVAAGEPFEIGWNSNVAPCVASGGASGDGWAGPLTGASGSKTVTIGSAGGYTYTVDCGSGGSTASDSMTLTIDPPAVSFLPHTAEVYTGRGVILQWTSSVGPCYKTGYWSTATPEASQGAAVLVIDSPGVHTFGLSCGDSNPVTATTQVTVKAIPTVTLTASATTPTVGEPVTLSWNSANATSCEVPGTPTGDWSGAVGTSGTKVVTSTSPGSVGYYISCDGEASDAVMLNWASVIKSPATTASPPTLSFTIDQTQRVSGESVTLTWTTTRSAVCHGAQGVNGDGWVGALPVSGTRTIAVTGEGTFTWELTCSGAPPAANATVSATYTSPPAPPPPPPPPPSGGGGSGGGGGGGGSLDRLLLGALLASLILALAARARARR